MTEWWIMERDLKYFIQILREKSKNKLKIGKWHGWRENEMLIITKL